ncbi:MAG TPA: class I SAM-dependent methyltransferase [Gaiellaceae bacterium]|nr:class I SAM-dependent methyltransferase [Gaiellaceae bacterium]
MGANDSSWPGPLALDDPGPIVALRQAFTGAGFDGDAVRRSLGAHDETVVRAGEAPLLRRRIEGLGALGTLIALFVLDLPVPVAEVEEALPGLTAARLEALGLAATVGGLVRTDVRIVPHGELVIVSDPGGRGVSQPDHVAGLHNASGMLDQLTVRRPIGTALDVGTGSGIHAITARRHSDRVVATDINVRALNFAAFNAILNGTPDIELRRGSFFEPVAGERFDLLVCNPPFVISPEAAFLFRDSGLEGDTVSRQLIEGTPALLEEGGYATVLVSWSQPNDEPWSAPLRRWLEGSGCDAILLLSSTQDPLAHASNWTRDRAAGDVDAFESALARWLDYLERHGIEGVSYGGVVLRRRRAGSNWIQEHVMPASGLEAAGAHLLRMFEAQDYLAGLRGDEELLHERLALTGTARVAQHVSLRENRWNVDAIRIRLDEGLGFDAEVDASTARFLAALDGNRTVAEVVDALAEGQPDREQVSRSALPVVRGLLELGYVERAPG